MSFTYTDLFAGIGGFHAVLSGVLGGECWFTSEIDPMAQAVYAHNWETVQLAGDIIPLTTDQMEVPPTDLLAAGFPCQPFSKSGFQRGIAETRGTLFFNIARVLEEHHPAVVLLENVRNLAGPRHRDTWAMIVGQLNDLGYKVSTVPTVFSPHLLPRALGGRPQVRERVFILGTYIADAHGHPDPVRARALSEPFPVVAHKPVDGWDPQQWDLETHLPLQDDTDVAEKYRLSEAEVRWVNTWQDLIDRLADRMDGDKLPGFPIWAEYFDTNPYYPADTPTWKSTIIEKNAAFYRRHRGTIDAWKAEHNNLEDMPPSRRKLEWQAQDTGSLWDTVLHMRPSGIRAKRPTYVPALVAITQTSIVGSRRRRITPKEGARLQGLPDWFDFADQPDAASYKQLGNGVSVGAAYYVLRQHVLADAHLIRDRAPGLVAAVEAAPENPDDALRTRRRREPAVTGVPAGVGEGGLLEAGPLAVAAQGRH